MPAALTMGVNDPYPPRELWPTYLRTLPAYAYPAELSLATELLDRHVAEGRGNRPALLTPEATITYAVLQSRVNRSANALRRLGVGRGDRVLLRLPNRPDFFAAWLAVQKLGAIGVATMPMLRARELRFVVDDCEPAVAIVSADLSDELERALRGAAARPTVVVTGLGSLPDGWEAFDELEAREDDVCDAVPVGRDEIVLVAYTSGSTGQPKGTCHSPADVLASADGYAAHVLRPAADDVFGGHPTLAFTFGLGGLLVFPLRAGAATALHPLSGPESILDAVGRARVTRLFCAATMYRLFLNIPDVELRYDLSSLRSCVSAGETLPAAVFEQWKARTGLEILDGLGTTEMFHIFVSSVPGRVRPGATGLPVPGYDVAVVDGTLAPVADGTPGLLAVRGPTGCKYWRNPDRQREYVRDGWNLPGDVYVRDSDGYFHYQCRNDDLIVSAGYNIAPPELEAVIGEHPAVAEVAVVGVPDDVRGEIPKAFVVLRPPAVATPSLAEEIQAHVKREIAPYKYPRLIEFVSALPKTETGKIRRVELRQRERTRIAPSS